MFSVSSHAHSGRYIHRQHTSFGYLSLILLLVVLVVDSFAFSTRADDTITVTASVVHTPPTAQATITNPVAGTEFTDSPITVEGTCEVGRVVKLFRNTVFAGSTFCSDSSTFSLSIGLISGTNSLTAANYDFVDQSGPLSPEVVVTFTPPAATPTPAATATAKPTHSPSVKATATPISGTTALGSPFLIEADKAIQSTYPGKELTWVVTLTGGSAPYAVAWDWGDKTIDAFNQSAAGAITATHSYKGPGRYILKIKAMDANGLSAYMELITVVSGTVMSTVKSTPTTPWHHYMVIAWSSLLVISLLILSFWLGEQFVLKRNAPRVA